MLSRKVALLCQAGNIEEGLRWYDAALLVKPDVPSTWALKGAALLQLKRLDEAFQSFQRAYELRDNFGEQRREYLKDLFLGWSTAALLRGYLGLLNLNSQEAEKGVSEYVAVVKKAKSEGIGQSIVEWVLPSKQEFFTQTWSEEETGQLEEMYDTLDALALMVRLYSIENPLEGWKAVAKEISKVIPPGASAVDLIREQRNTNGTNDS